MRIEHTAVYVRDLDRAKAFYEQYFSAKPNDMYHNPKTGLKTYFLSFESGGRLELMAKPGIAETDCGREQIGFTHLAFCVGGREAVDSLTGRLRDDGYTVYSEPRQTGDGYYESCISDPDGNRIEIVAD